MGVCIDVHSLFQTHYSESKQLYSTTEIVIVRYLSYGRGNKAIGSDRDWGVLIIYSRIYLVGISLLGYWNLTREKNKYRSSGPYFIRVTGLAWVVSIHIYFTWNKLSSTLSSFVFCQSVIPTWSSSIYAVCIDIQIQPKCVSSTSSVVVRLMLIFNRSECQTLVSYLKSEFKVRCWELGDWSEIGCLKIVSCWAAGILIVTCQIQLSGQNRSRNEGRNSCSIANRRLHWSR